MDPDRRKSFSILLPGLVYLVLWYELFLPRPESVLDASWYLVSALKSLGRFVLLLLLAKGIPGNKAWPRARDFLDALGVAALAALSAWFLRLVLQPKGNAAILDSGALGAAGLAAAGLWCLAVGYSEELFFRFFAPDSLGEAGFSPLAAQGAAALLFGLSHTSQGIVGILVSGLLGLGFGWIRLKGRSFHAIALGHALYNAILLASSISR